MTDRFFAIRLILKYGTAGSAVLAACIALAAAFLLWPGAGWAVVVIAPLVAGVAFVLCKSYTEMVSIVFSLVH